MAHAHTHDHHHGHDHHGHGHGHSHAPADFGRAFAIGIVLNTGFVAVEAGAGFFYGSMALVADAGHNLSDVLALALAWIAAIAAKRPASGRYTYGYKSSTILAALANALLLAIVIGALLFETFHRLTTQQEPEGMAMVVVAGIGIAINALTAMLFVRGQEDLNIRGAYLHMAADAAVSLGVVLAGLAILWSGFAWIDGVVSIAILAVIAWGTWGLARDSFAMGLLAAPAGIDLPEVRRHLAGLEGVTAIHDLHVWPMSTTETALTAHLVMPDKPASDRFLHDVAASLRSRFGVGHVTLQIESGDNPCELGC
jgi:cobalt-zinc-cadmium efflux system protein